MNFIRKVCAFVVRRPDDGDPYEPPLFTYIDFPDDAIQIPDGGIEPGDNRLFPPSANYSKKPAAR